jgi:hypothetical protein
MAESRELEMRCLVISGVLVQVSSDGNDFSRPRLKPAATREKSFFKTMEHYNFLKRMIHRSMRRKKTNERPSAATTKKTVRRPEGVILSQ